jgi:hypothetical protein
MLYNNMGDDIMKKFIKIPIIFLAFLILISYNTVKAEESLDDYKIDSLFSVHKLNLKDNTFIMDYKGDDVNGDNIKDNIILVGVKNDRLGYAERDDIKLIIQDGSSKKYYKLSPGKFVRGNNGRVFLGDFNGDKVLDIFVSFCGKGNGNYPWYSLISFKDNKADYILKQENFTLGLTFDIKFVDDYKISIFNKELNKFYYLNADNKKDTYNNKGIYDDNGTSLKEQVGLADAISELRPVDVNKDGVYELVGMQIITGICASDILGYAKSVWGCEGKTIKLMSLQIIPYAKPGNLDKIQRVVPVNNIIN